MSDAGISDAGISDAGISAAMSAAMRGPAGWGRTSGVGR